jgi:hypothetical protein
MRKKALELNERGEYEISMGNKIVGKLLPWNPRDPKTKYKVQIGEFGGYYHCSLDFKEALKYFEKVFIDTQTRLIQSTIRSCILIHSRTKPIKNEH